MKKLGNLLLVLAMCLMFSVTAKADTGLTEVMGGNSVETATPVSFNEDYVSTKGENEDLYYKFTTPNKKAWYFFYVKNINIPNSYDNYRFEFIVENAYGENIVDTGGSVYSPNKTDTISVILEPSTTYYIHAYGAKAGNFRFFLYYNEDKVGDDKENATKASLNSNVTSTIDGPGDVDWFCFQTGNYKDYILNFKNLAGDSMSIYVYNQYGEVLAYDNYVYSDEYDGVNLYLNNMLKNTKYYIKIYSYNYRSYGQKYLFNVYPNRTHIQDITATYNTTYTYSGKTIQPYVRVTYNGNTLSSGTDYTISYSNNKKPGKGKITIKGINGYTGTVTKYFDILPKKQKIKSVKNVSGRKMKVSYTRDINVTGYEIQYSPYKNFLYYTETVKVKGKKNSSKTIKNLTKNQTYYVRVRSYVKSGSSTVTGNWSSVKKVKIKK